MSLDSKAEDMTLGVNLRQLHTMVPTAHTGTTLAPSGSSFGHPRVEEFEACAHWFRMPGPAAKLKVFQSLAACC